MGSYGVGVTRVLAALAEANNDERGLAWPAHVAPAHVTVVATGKDPAVFEAAEALAVELSSRGIEVLYDDRPGRVSPGVKFADAELAGCPAGGRRRSRSRRGCRRGPSAHRRHHRAGPGRPGGRPRGVPRRDPARRVAATRRGPRTPVRGPQPAGCWLCSGRPGKGIGVAPQAPAALVAARRPSTNGRRSPAGAPATALA